MAAFIYVSKKDAKTIILFVCSKCSFVRMNLMHYNVTIWDRGQLIRVTKFYHWNISYFFSIEKHVKH